MFSFFSLVQFVYYRFELRLLILISFLLCKSILVSNTESLNCFLSWARCGRHEAKPSVVVSLDCLVSKWLVSGWSKAEGLRTTFLWCIQTALATCATILNTSIKPFRLVISPGDGKRNSIFWNGEQNGGWRSSNGKSGWEFITNNHHLKAELDMKYALLSKFMDVFFAQFQRLAPVSPTLHGTLIHRLVQSQFPNNDQKMKKWLSDF